MLFSMQWLIMLLAPETGKNETYKDASVHKISLYPFT